MLKNKINLILIFLIFSVCAFAQVQLNPGWGLDRIDQRTGFDLAYHYSATGQGVTVYVVDSGIQLDNPEFEGRAANGYGRYQKNCNGHGTGVAGVIGSRSFGVAKQVTLVSVRVQPCSGVALATDVIKGLNWILRNARGPSVVNISANGTYYPDFNTAVQNLINAGIVVVVGAGNDSQDACYHSPSAVMDAIVVGATRSDDTSAPWSNFGSCVDLYAPGEGIATTWTTAPVTYGSGTSYSAPIVTGVAAMYLETHPLASPQEVRDAIVSNTTPDVILGANPNLFIYSL
jgi:subtilisin family serine protease